MTLDLRFPQVRTVLLVALVVVFVALCRLRLAGIPIERDEGEYGYGAQQFLQGVAPAASIYHVKLPGIYVVYAAVLSLFGQSAQGIHLGLLVVNAASTISLFLLGRMLFGPTAGVVSAACYALFTLSQSTLGFTANAEQFILLPALAGLAVLLGAMETSRKVGRPASPAHFALAGFLLGFAFVIKQQGAVFIAVALLILVHARAVGGVGRWRDVGVRSGVLLAAAAVPFACICLAYWRVGFFDRFWWWAFSYPRLYMTLIDVPHGLVRFFLTVDPMWRSFSWLVPIAVLGVVALAWDLRSSRAVSVYGLLVLPILPISAGFYFFPHYFLLAAPGLALATGGGAVAMSEIVGGRLHPDWRHSPGILLVLVALIHAVWVERAYLFGMEANEVLLTSFGTMLFSETESIGELIHNNSSLDDRVVVIGSEPEVYFYANRRAATGYIYTFELMNQHQAAAAFQQEMIGEIEAARPKYVLFVHDPGSWYATYIRPYDAPIFSWASAYIERQYTQVGVVDLDRLDRGQTAECWARPGSFCYPESDRWMALYRM